MGRGGGRHRAAGRGQRRQPRHAGPSSCRRGGGRRGWRGPHGTVGVLAIAHAQYHDYSLAMDERVVSPSKETNGRSVPADAHAVVLRLHALTLCPPSQTPAAASCVTAASARAPEMAAAPRAAARRRHAAPPVAHTPSAQTRVPGHPRPPPPRRHNLFAACARRCGVGPRQAARTWTRT